MTVQIIIGGALEQLRKLPKESVDCAITSPPYWGLRDYNMSGQIGLEQTLPEFIDALVTIFREVRRVLRKDGTLWLNLGDSYSRALGMQNLKPKDLCMIPARMAMALQEDGWWLRSEIIWHKPNPMPESVTDRPTSSHEKIFLLAKSERYYFDAKAVKESSLAKGGLPGSNMTDTRETHGTGGGNSGLVALRRRLKEQGHVDPDRNIRNVWTIPTKPFKGAHFATFPPALIEPCVKAGCPEGGTVLDPFAGAGTTGLVADRLDRNAILIELNPAYAAMMKARLIMDGGMFMEIVEGMNI